MIENPEAIVQRQVEAYNAHDIESFMASYGLGILVTEFPSGDIVTVGHLAMRAEYENYLRDGKPHVEIAKRIVRGNKIIDHEMGRDLHRPSWEAVVIYEVAEGLIQRVWIVRG